MDSKNKFIIVYKNFRFNAQILMLNLCFEEDFQIEKSEPSNEYDKLSNFSPLITLCFGNISLDIFHLRINII